MRQRLSKEDRRLAILGRARALFDAQGYGATEMEDIRRACGISRGGLYHHFANQRAILQALAFEDAAALAAPARAGGLRAVLEQGAVHLGAGEGLLSALTGRAERLDYIAGYERGLDEKVALALTDDLRGDVVDGVLPEHVTELFLTVNARINRRQILGEWSHEEARAFAATALGALLPFLKDPQPLHAILAELR